MKSFWSGVLGGLIVIAFTAMLWYGYEKYQSEKLLDSLTDVEDIELMIPTMEQRLNDFQIDKQDYEMYDLCMQLPEETVKLILKRIGTTATYAEIAEEYTRNIDYYVSKQVETKIKDIDSPGVENARVEIKSYSKLKVDKKPLSIKTEVKDTVK